MSSAPSAKAEGSASATLPMKSNGEENPLRPDQLANGPSAHQAETGSRRQSGVASRRLIPMSPSELGTKGTVQQLFGGRRRRRAATLHRRAAARQPDRAAARLSDAVAQPALWRRQRRTPPRRSTTTRTPVGEQSTAADRSIARFAMCSTIACARGLRLGLQPTRRPREVPHVPHHIRILLSARIASPLLALPSTAAGGAEAAGPEVAHFTLPTDLNWWSSPITARRWSPT